MPASSPAPRSLSPAASARWLGHLHRRQPPGVSEVVPLLIVGRLEQFDFAGAAVLGTAMLALSLLLLATINALDLRARRHA